MNKFTICLMVFGLVFNFTAVLAEDDVLKPLDAFELENVSAPQISPDGEQIIYVRNFSDIMTDSRFSNIWIVNFDGSNHRALTTGNYNENTPRWSPDGSKIVFTSNREGSQQIYSRDMRSGDTRRISNLPSSPSGLRWSPDGTQIAFTMLKEEKAPEIYKMPTPPPGAEWEKGPHITDKLVYRFDGAGYLTPGYHHIYTIPAEGGTAKQISTGDFQHAGPGSRAGAISWTPDSNSIIVSANRGANYEFETYDLNVFKFDVGTQRVTQLTDRFGPENSATVSPDGKWIALTGFLDERQGFKRNVLGLVPIGGGDIKDISTELDQSIHTFKWASDSQSLYVAFDEHGATKLGRMTLDGNLTIIKEGLGGGSGASAYAGDGPFSVSHDGKIAAIYTDPHTPSDVMAGQASFNRITDINGDLLDHKTLGDVEEIWYKSSKDGLDIQGWVIKPPHFDPTKKYPFIIEIHGGPFADYGPRFDFEKQLMAASGYVVLYANPRGSTSYGEEFGNKIHHAYPGDDFYDLNSGVDAVIEQGYVDEDRLYVGGGSGGGVLTAWMIGHTDRFKAASVYYPVIEWASFNLTTDIPGVVNNNWFPGVPWRNIDHYAERSLLSVVDNVKTPTILITGEEDHRTPISQAEQYYSALKINGVEAVNIRIPDEAHGTRAHPSHWLTRIMNTIGWFDKHQGLKPIS